MARATQVCVHATGDNAAPGGWFDCHLAGQPCRSPDATGAAPDESWLIEATAALEAEHGDQLPAIAKTLGLSYETFRKKFKSR
jgi:methylphosphotriester-DNA--protein-cysteine methyltransferase